MCILQEHILGCSRHDSTIEGILQIKDLLQGVGRHFLKLRQSIAFLNFRRICLFLGVPWSMPGYIMSVPRALYGLKEPITTM